jgi:general secretion pathway protein G
MKNLQLIKNSRGMTLVEILAVIVLLTLVMGVVVRGVFGRADAAKATLNQTKMETVVKSAINQYRLQYNSYPDKLEDLRTPSAKMKKAGGVFMPMIDEEGLLDVFGYPFIYKMENNNRSYSLTSLGADGVAGGEGADQDLTITP